MPDKLRQIRQLCGFSQEAVATSVGISQTAESRLEGGKSKLTLELIEQIAQFYKLSLSELLNDDLPTIGHKLIDRKVIVSKMGGITSGDAPIE